jgi:hypothetical protein
MPYLASIAPKILVAIGVLSVPVAIFVGFVIMLALSGV